MECTWLKYVPRIIGFSRRGSESLSDGDGHEPRGGRRVRPPAASAAAEPVPRAAGLLPTAAAAAAAFSAAVATATAVRSPPPCPASAPSSDRSCAAPAAAGDFIGVRGQTSSPSAAIVHSDVVIVVGEWRRWRPQEEPMGRQPELGADVERCLGRQGRQRQKQQPASSQRCPTSL